MFVFTFTSDVDDEAEEVRSEVFAHEVRTTTRRTQSNYRIKTADLPADHKLITQLDEFNAFLTTRYIAAESIV